jgi:hypothetical protein
MLLLPPDIKPPSGERPINLFLSGYLDDLVSKNTIHLNRSEQHLPAVIPLELNTRRLSIIYKLRPLQNFWGNPLFYPIHNSCQCV